MLNVNIPVALIEGLKAVTVVFNHPSKAGYTYLSNFDVEVGDKVVVLPPNGVLTVVTVIGVEDTFNIEANYEYKFLVAKVDMEGYEALQEAIEEVRDIVEREVRGSARKQIIDALGLKQKTVAKINAVANRVTKL